VASDMLEKAMGVRRSRHIHRVRRPFTGVADRFEEQSFSSETNFPLLPLAIEVPVHDD
jgi:hypothetical protein